MKNIIPLLLLFIFACTSKNNEVRTNINNDSSNVEERISTHRQDWENNRDNSSSDNSIDNYELKIESENIITQSLKGYFDYPRFLSNEKLIFTVQDYNQIWLYDFNSKKSMKLVELPLCGANFQVSRDGKNVYFRNRATRGEKRGGVYSIFKYSIPNNQMEVVYKSANRISTPTLVNNYLYFLENDKPTSFNLKTNQAGRDFKVPFYYVDNNHLIKLTDRQDTISLQENYKFIDRSYSHDLGYISAFTIKKYCVVFDIEGNFIQTFNGTRHIDKLMGSNLVVYSMEKDDGMKIISSDLVVGFLNNDRKIIFKNDNNEQRFNPTWAPTANMIAYSNSKGQLKTITFKIK